MCYQMSLYPKTMSNWISKLPLCSFPSSQFAYGLGDWEALWDGDPLLQIGILERFPPPAGAWQVPMVQLAANTPRKGVLLFSVTAIGEALPPRHPQPRLPR